MKSSLRATLRADLARNVAPFDRATVLVYRLKQAAARSRLRAFLLPLATVLDVVWSQALMGAELPASVECGPGLRLAHGGRGVIVNPRVRIGSRATIYHRVTLGVIGAEEGNVPTIGDDVYIGTGATIAGRLHIGDGARIGAGAVVVHDVPAGATAVGVPARVR